MKKEKKFIKTLCLASVLVGLISCGGTYNNEKIIIGLECNYAPFNWAERNSNDYTMEISNRANSFADGYDIQIAKLIGKDLGKEVTIVQTEWVSLIGDLQSGSINCVIAGMTDTEERRQAIDFTEEYYRSELVLVVKKDIADLYNKTLSEEEFKKIIDKKMIVSQKDTLTNDLIDIFVNNYSAIKNTPVSTFALAATDVNNGSAFAMTAEYPVAKSIVSSNQNLGIIKIDQNILGEEQASLGVSIGIQKGNTELQTAINSVLSKIKQSTRDDIMLEALKRSSNL